jgi:phosphatidylglycerol lysyltransferase
MRARLGWIGRHGPAIFGVVLLFGALYVVQKEFRGLKVADVRAAMEGLPQRGLLLGAMYTTLAYLVLMIYDRLGSIYAGHKVSWARSFLASFCAYSLAHNLGFAAVSGAAVRYRLYSAWGLKPVEIAKVVGFCSLTYGLGGMILGGFVLLLEPEVVPFFGAAMPAWSLQLIALPLWGIVATYITLSRFIRRIRLFGNEIELPGITMAFGQVALATVDVAVTAAIFYAVLPENPELTFVRFVGIYLAAYTAGITANVPGGIGVFDGAILLGLQPFLPVPEIIGGLLMFRVYYYVVPLFVSGALFAGFELSQRRGVLRRLNPLGNASRPLEVPVLGSLVVLVGAVLVFLGAVPIRDTIMLQWAGREAALASHFAASVIGSLLLVMAFGLFRRLGIAWVGALPLLLAGAGIAWLRGEGWWIWGGVLLVAAMLAAMRGAFYRDARLLREPMSAETLLPLLAVVACGITLAFIGYGGRVAHISWWAMLHAADTPLALRVGVVVPVVLLLVALVRLLRPAPLTAAPWDAATRQRLTLLRARTPAVADGAMFGERGLAGFGFLRCEGTWLALGEPGGERQDAISAIWRFRDLCERAGVDPAFWNVGPEFLQVYADIGMTAVPMAPEDGAPRWLACRAERDLGRLRGLLPPELQDSLLLPDAA